LEEAANLERLIRESEFCAVIEVTNGISNRRLDNKIDEAVHARKFMRELVRNPGLDVLTGIFFFRATKLKKIDDPRLDFYSQIPEYDANRAVAALARASERAIYECDKAIAEQFMRLVGQGHPLSELMYPVDWEHFKSRFPELATDQTQEHYFNRIGTLKGIFLEDYGEMLCTESLKKEGKQPTHVHLAVQYGKHAGKSCLVPQKPSTPAQYRCRGEIDLLIIGDREHIITALSDPEYFKAYFSKAYSSSFSGSSSLRTSSS